MSRRSSGSRGARLSEARAVPVGAGVKFLVTNDDGFDAPGLAALIAAIDPLGEVLVVAPHQHLSGCSHAATTSRALELITRAPQRHQLDGTPVDCTRVALAHLAPEIDWVVSGINAGGNLGHDVYLSGTVAAVREAALLGKPGIAVSQYVARRWPIDWETAACWTSEIVRELMRRPQRPGLFWNVNLPDLEAGAALPPWVDCPLDPGALPVRYELEEEGRLRYRARYQDRSRVPACDVDVCFSGRIAVTALTVGST